MYDARQIFAENYAESMCINVCPMHYTKADCHSCCMTHAYCAGGIAGAPSASAGSTTSKRLHRKPRLHLIFTK